MHVCSDQRIPGSTSDEALQKHAANPAAACFKRSIWAERKRSRRVRSWVYSIRLLLYAMPLLSFEAVSSMLLLTCGSPTAVGVSPRMLSGGITLALVGSLGQLTFNQLNIARIRYLSRQEATLPLVVDASDAEIAGDSQTTQQLEPPPAPPLPLVHRVTDVLFSVTPIRKVSDEEYAVTLRDKVDQSRKDLQSVEQELEAIKARLDQLRPS